MNVFYSLSDEDYKYIYESLEELRTIVEKNEKKP